jgi:P2-related tail formation protein
MTNLQSLKLSDLLPSSIMGDETVRAIAASVDNELQAITACINEIIMLPRIDELPADVVDHLAGQLHVDYYEPLGLDLDKRRALVKSSLTWHRRKGTKSVLEEVIRILFLDDFEIEEWYEYGGEPYFFRLIFRDKVFSWEQYQSLLRAVYELKNVRSWLESVKRYFETEGTIYWGAAGRQVKKYTIDNTVPPDQVVRSADVYAACVGKQSKRYEIFANMPALTVDAAETSVGVVYKRVSKINIGSSQEVIA